MSQQRVTPDVFLEPQDDGLPMRPCGPWVAEKLFYLARYLNMFSVSMSKKPWRAINYVDLFAGPGKCQVRGQHTIYLGSPLLALTASRPFSRCFFVDCDVESIEALKRRSSSSPLSDRIEHLVGDSNMRVREIVDHIKGVDVEYRPGVWPSLNLAFLDPDGLELNWETVAALSEVRTDLIIHYSQMGVTRAAPGCVQEAGETALDRFFGGTGWRSVYSLPHRTGRLLEHYMGKLRELGYEEVKRDDELWVAPLIRSKTRKAPLYRLLFASRSPLGHKFWREVTSKDVHGQQRLF
jgi:three-Cys-motif partner protein